MDRTGRIHFNTLVAFLNKIGGKLINFAGTIIFANLAGSSPLGIYYTFISLSRLISRVSLGGIGQTIIKRVSEEGASSFSDGRVLGTALVMRFLVLGLLFGPIVVFRHNFDRYIGISGSWLLLCTVLVFSTVYESCRATLRGKKRIAFASSLQTIQFIVAFLFQVSFILLGYFTIGLILGYVLGIAIALLLIIYTMDIGFVAPTRDSLRSFVDFTKYSYIDDLFMWENHWLDVLILKLFVNPSLVGIYGVMYALSRVGLTFSTPLSLSIFPEVSELSNKGGDNIWTEQLQMGLKYSTLFTIPLVAGTTVVGDLVTADLYNFQTGHRTLVIVSVGIVFLGIYEQIHQVFYGLNRPRLAMICSLTAALMKVITLLVFIPLFGIIGASLSALISMFTAFVFGVALMGHQYTIRGLLPVRGWGIQIVGGTATGISAGGTRFMLNTHSIPTMIISILIGVVVYFVVVLSIDRGFRNRAISLCYSTFVMYN